MIHLRIFTFFLLLVCSFSQLHAQKHDNNWVMGKMYSKENGALCNGLCEGFYYSFSDTGKVFSKLNTGIEMEVTNATISDRSGRLMCFTNGLQVKNFVGDRIHKGDTLNSSCNYVKTANINSDYGLPDSHVFIPDDEHEGIYYLYQLTMSWVDKFGYTGTTLRVTKIDMNADNGKGKVIFMNKVLQELQAVSIQFTRHANGRDWWCVAPHDRPNIYNVILLHNDKVLSYQEQSIGKTYPDSIRGFSSQKCFSPDGSLYVDCGLYVGVRVYNFDRCKGRLSLLKQHLRAIPPKDLYDKTGATSAIISPNNRFVYVGYENGLGSNFVQYDLNEPDFLQSKTLIRDVYGFYNYNPPWDHKLDTLSFVWKMQYGPDGKIYLSHYKTYAGGMYVISKPDEKGVGCELCSKNCFTTPYWNGFSMPSFPNYRLGALKGSPCDTLHVANKEIGIMDYGLKLMPNPASDQIQLDITLPEYDPGTKTEIVILDVAGEVVIRYPMPDFAYLATVDISALAGGVYAVQLRQRNQVMAVEKLVVVR